MAYKITNPYTGEVLTTFDTLIDEQLQTKISKVQSAFETWSKTAFGERAAIPHRAADLVVERRNDLAAINSTETKKSLQIAEWEMNLCAQIMNYYADNAEGDPGRADESPYDFRPVALEHLPE